MDSWLNRGRPRGGVPGGLPDRGVAHHSIDWHGHVPVDVLGRGLDAGDATVGDGAGSHGEHRCGQAIAMRSRLVSWYIECWRAKAS
jgi:hypothetical protein